MSKAGKLVYAMFVLVFAFAATGLCQAQAKCPWLNSATAAGVLGGEVELSVTAPPEMPASSTSYAGTEQRADRFDVTCTFQRKAGEETYRLQIAVSTLANPSVDFLPYLARCSSKVALVAIGNEAVQCQANTSAESSKLSTEQVIARVRNRAFVLTLNRIPEAAAKSNETGLSDDARNLAEQVAGSLF